jgi:hypothetical protein
LTEQKFTNAIDVSITVDNNGIYPMLKTSKGRHEYAVLRDADLPAFLKAMLDNSMRTKGRTTTVTVDGKPSVKVGDGGAAGIVYKPTTDDQAKRNLNFALANLAAYVEWETTGKAEAEAEAKKKAEALESLRKQAKEIEERAAKRRAEEAAENRKRRDALLFYNKVNLTSFYTWSGIPFMSETIIKHWIELSEANRRVRFNSGGLIPTSPLYPTTTGRTWL